MNWINVNDELPEDYKEVMYFVVNELGSKEIMIGHRENGIWSHCCMFYATHFLNEKLAKVTHWAELPDYPVLPSELLEEISEENNKRIMRMRLNNSKYGVYDS